MPSGWGGCAGLLATLALTAIVVSHVGLGQTELAQAATKKTALPVLTFPMLRLSWPTLIAMLPSGCAASGGALAPEPPRATRSQPEPTMEFFFCALLCFALLCFALLCFAPGYLIRAQIFKLRPDTPPLDMKSAPVRRRIPAPCVCRCSKLCSLLSRLCRACRPNLWTRRRPRSSFRTSAPSPTRPR